MNDFGRMKSRWSSAILAPVVIYGAGALLLQVAATELRDVSPQELTYIELAIIVVTVGLAVLSGGALAPKHSLGMSVGIGVAAIIFVAAQSAFSSGTTHSAITVLLAHAAGAGGAILLVWMRQAVRPLRNGH